MYSRGVSIPRGQSYRRPICIYYFLGSTGTQRCRLPVDPRGSAATVTGRSQRARIRSGIFDFRSVQLYTLSNLPSRKIKIAKSIWRVVSNFAAGGRVITGSMFRKCGGLAQLCNLMPPRKLKARPATSAEAMIKIRNRLFRFT